MAQRVRRYGFIRTLVFFVWCIGPLWLRQIIDRSVILICRWLNIQQLKTVVNQTEIFIVPKCPWIVYRYFIVGRYDEEEINWIRGRIPSHYTFIDVGANFGVWTFSLAEHFREVLAFEPDPECFACLKKTKVHLGNSHVSLFPLALSDENREGTLLPSRSSKGDGRIYDPMDNERLEGIKIPIRTFDSLAQEKGLNKEFIFLKLDVQGAEPCVLRGMQNSFKRAKDVLLWMEVQNQILASAGETADGLFALLKEMGFKPVAFSDSFDEVSWDQRQRDLKSNKDFCFRYQPLP